ncbi:efflux RND transporter periplasmic adaptor subunit [Paenibacillus sedimenti]|uniref:Efflux RND transporter periplasmic adaptor subunit n=1 Tax=Paenibacillus sedimenti TaxID=2770274 RepID=A0A926KJG2_9BACL|nr:efflux RND transporter periplasmic adaptor subunit [Paenibacillus sedimenti]MBD0378720.1 efflux RND transporter periplasmic adaptor subunit [Paenibacillus sedimenti]
MLRKALWGALVIVLLVVAVLVTSVFFSKGSTAAAVKVATTQEGSITKEVFANGKIESKVIKEHFVTSGGFIEKIHVKKGDLVRKGQELLTLSTTDLDAKLKQEKHQLQLNLAEKEKFLNDQEKVRKQTLETAKKEMNETGSAASLETFDENSAADVELYDLKIQDAESNIDDIRKKLEKNRLLADIDGIVTGISVKEGQEITTGTSSFMITNVSQLQIKANLAENDANLAKVGMKVKVTGDAFTNSYAGSISYISPVAVASELDAKESVVEFTVDLEQPSPELRPGYKATVQITMANSSHIIVPLGAVKRDGQQSYVFKVVANKAVRTNVKLGEENDEFIEVLEGLQAGEQFIEAPSADVKDGVQVDIQ